MLFTNSLLGRNQPGEALVSDISTTFRVARGGGGGVAPPLPPPHLLLDKEDAVWIRGEGGGPPLPKAPRELSSCDCCFCVYCRMLGNFYCRVWHAVCRPDAEYNINVSLLSCSSAFQLLVPSFRPPCSQVRLESKTQARRPYST